MRHLLGCVKRAIRQKSKIKHIPSHFQNKRPLFSGAGGDLLNVCFHSEAPVLRHEMDIRANKFIKGKLN